MQHVLGLGLGVLSALIYALLAPFQGHRVSADSGHNHLVLLRYRARVAQNQVGTSR